ncbi:MAG: hypothetical protein MK212_01105 [Saprospiraceae bacterium]|nr:hypothetical protein [Saprospiraceae bacterium]
MKNILIAFLLISFSFQIMYAQDAYELEVEYKDWTFDAKKLKIKIKKYKKPKDGMVRLTADSTASNMPWMMALIEDSIYTKNPKRKLKINGKKFTGTLSAYPYRMLRDYSIAFLKGKRNGKATYNYSSGLIQTVIYENNVIESEENQAPTVDPGDYQVYKPIIYLYPEKEQLINVKMKLRQGKLVHTYPRYPEGEGWSVQAKPNGELLDPKTGKSYYALYWEGATNYDFDCQEGFVVKGEEASAFLEEKLTILGLNRKELNEFMVYWLPKLEKNDYNFIHFAQAAYEDFAQMQIEPKPESLIRIFMLYQELDKPTELKEQVLQKVERKGFTVVEWGGAALPHKLN